MQLMMRGFEMGALFGCSLEADPHVWEAKVCSPIFIPLRVFCNFLLIVAKRTYQGFNIFDENH